MRIEHYLRSLTVEFEALRDRVRQLIEDQHWQSDGEWKESVLRHVLRRHLPSSVAVGRGFVVTTTDVSHQIDVLITDASKPVLFRDGDLAIVTPDAVVGIIEVKTSAQPSDVAEAAMNLAHDIGLVHDHPNLRAFAGLFSFEDGGGNAAAFLDALASCAPRWSARTDFVCVGTSRFIRYWHFLPENVKWFYQGWRSYRLPDTAPGYFVHNIIEAVSSESVGSNKDVWFPPSGKKPFCDGEIPGTWPADRRRADGTRISTHLQRTKPGHGARTAKPRR